MLPDPNQSRYRRWQSLLSVGSFVVAVGSASAANADVVRITSVNGDYDANHETVVDVHPGDVVTLSADVFSDASADGLTPQNRYVEDFVWTADDRSPQGGLDECDASQGQNCLGISNFEVNDYGVSFYVPYDFGAQTTVRVRSRSVNAGEDWITLRNADYAQDPGNYQPPTEVVTEPEQYQRPTLDPDIALAGHGRWVVVAGTRYFVPYAYQTDWVPYQNGYWSWTDDGYTWVSYDPWGWVTDHYGVWRHHSSFGWVWLPFEDRHYRPHCVTWFHDNDGYVGWYPYHNDYSRGYRHGYNEGFNDGFWAGYNAGRYYGGAGFVPGFTVVRFGHFVHRNIYDVRVGGSVIVNVWRTGYGHSYYGSYPGAPDLHSSRRWIEDRCGQGIPVTRVYDRGRGFRYPGALYPVPPTYRNPGYIGGGLNRPLPVGSVFRPGAPGAPGRPGYIPPTADGRGIALPPRVYDPRGGVYRPLPPQTNRPVAPNPNNPVFRPAPRPAQPATPPVFRPGQPGPRPPVVNPGPAPRPPVVNPGPAPRPPVVNPGPAPRPPVFNPPSAPAPRPPVAPAPRPPVAPAPRPPSAPAPRPPSAPAPRPPSAPAPRPPSAPAPRPPSAPAPRPPSFNPPSTPSRPTPPSGGPSSPGPRPPRTTPGPRPH